jgi:hypothetical protein
LRLIILLADLGHKLDNLAVKWGKGRHADIAQGGVKKYGFMNPAERKENIVRYYVNEVRESS